MPYCNGHLLLFKVGIYTVDTCPIPCSCYHCPRITISLKNTLTKLIELLALKDYQNGMYYPQYWYLKP